jgi:predicted cupin superfamily sugar epimerase
MKIMLPEVKALIDFYQFELLPVEGTLFVKTWQSDLEFSSNTPLSTAMIGLYCEQPQSQSLFHKLAVDEIWHFYQGDPLRLILLYPDGSSRDVVMGTEAAKGQQVQTVVPAGVWQAGHLLKGGRFALFGCTLSPGFTPDIFTGGGIDQLLAKYPEREEDIYTYGCKNALFLPE